MVNITNPTLSTGIHAWIVVKNLMENKLLNLKKYYISTQTHTQYMIIKKM